MAAGQACAAARPPGARWCPAVAGDRSGDESGDGSWSPPSTRQGPVSGIGPTKVSVKSRPPSGSLPRAERALVLHGGGSAGNAWEIGVIAGLFDAGLDVTEADLIIGTSAGSTAAAQITSGTQPTELLATILAAAPQPRTGPVGPDGGRVPNGAGGQPYGDNEPNHRRR